MLHYSDAEQEEEFKDVRLNPLVRAITLLAASYSFYRFGEIIWLTSVFRKGDPGVHGAWRGTDADNDKGLKPKQKEEIRDYINKLFSYDPERPRLNVCVYHTVKGRGGDHLHFQVHPNTELRRS